MRDTKVRLDGWCEGGSTMGERLERMENPGTYVT